MHERDPAFLRRFSVLDDRRGHRRTGHRNPAGHRDALRDAPPRADRRPGHRRALRLAKRYLQDRALPDSAVDLLDKTAARKRVEIDGVPAEVDDAIRRLASLKAQLASLTDDIDAMSVKTRTRIEKEIAELKPNVKRDARASSTRAGARSPRRPPSARSTRARDQLAERATRQDFARLGELEHVTAPDVKRRLEAARSAVAQEGDRPRERRHRGGRRARRSAIGPASPSQDARGREREAPQDGGTTRRARRRSRRGRGADRRGPCAAAASGCATPESPSGRSSFSGRAASARPSSPRRSPSSCSTTSRP